MRRLIVVLCVLMLIPAAAMYWALVDPVEAAPGEVVGDVAPELHAPTGEPGARDHRRSRRRTKTRRAPKRDPLRIGLDTQATEVAFVDFAGFRNSELGEYILGCVPASAVHELTDKLGIDVIERLERAAIQEDLALFTGDFEGANWSRLVDDAKPFRYGDRAQLYDPGKGGALAVWDDRVIIAGPDANAVEAAVDRLEGRAPSAKMPALPGHFSGTVPLKDLVRQLPMAVGSDELFEGAQAWFSVTADADMHLNIEVAHHDPDRQREVEELLAEAVRSGVRGMPWLPITHERGVFSADVSGDFIRNMMPCARPTL